MKKKTILGLIFSISFVALGFEDEKSAYKTLEVAYQSQETAPKKREMVGNREYTLVYGHRGIKSVKLDCSLKTLIPWESKKELFCKFENGVLVKASIGGTGICVNNYPTTTFCFRSYASSQGTKHILAKVINRAGSILAYGFQVKE